MGCKLDQRTPERRFLLRLETIVLVFASCLPSCKPNAPQGEVMPHEVDLPVSREAFRTLLVSSPGEARATGSGTTINGNGQRNGQHLALRGSNSRGPRRVHSLSFGPNEQIRFLFLDPFAQRIPRDDATRPSLEHDPSRQTLFQWQRPYVKPASGLLLPVGVPGREFELSFDIRPIEVPYGYAFRGGSVSNEGWHVQWESIPPG